MGYDVSNKLENYYELLGVAPDAPTMQIQQAVTSYRENLQTKLNNPRTMSAARSALDELLPALMKALLADDAARNEYNRLLAEFKQRQSQPIELADNEGLDDEIEHPFFFDPFDGYDTETPAYTLRQVAMKLDNEWSTALTWIKNTSQDTHVLVGYLTFAAGRQRLAERIERVIEAVSLPDDSRMDANEGIERCIEILDPDVERALVGIQDYYFAGNAFTFNAGDFIPDLPAYTEMTLYHEGVRGCAFGVIEARPNLVAFRGGASTQRFALMPQGTEPGIGVSEVTLPLVLLIRNLPRNADYVAQLLLRLENRDPVAEFPITIQFHVQALPPRVVFDPPALHAGIARRGTPVSIQVTAKNTGDENHIPLVARISTKDPFVTIKPERFHAGEPITLTIDTRSRPTGKNYEVLLDIDYSLTPGASGPRTLHVDGAIYPTAPQSLWQQKSVGNRIAASLLIGLVACILLSGVGMWAQGRTNTWWLLFLLVPLAFVAAFRKIVTTIVAHTHRSGKTSVRVETFLPPLVLWGLPTVIALLLVTMCALLPAPTPSLLLGAMTGALSGLVLGFMWDDAQPMKREHTDP